MCKSIIILNHNFESSLSRMSQAGGMSPCTQSIMMGGIMGCGVGGAAGTVLGFAGGLFGGQRRMALVKNTGR